MNKRRSVSFIVSAAAVLSFAAMATGQKVHPKQDDPILYSSFCFFMEDFSPWLDARAAAVPANKTKLMQSAARYLHVDPSELPKVAATCKSLAATLRQINLTAHNYYQTAVKNRQPLDSATLSSFDTQRQVAIQSGINKLRQELSAAGWSGLYAHLMRSTEHL